jgi:hypothetical protein
MNSGADSDALPLDLAAIISQLDLIDSDARELAAGLNAEMGTRSPQPGSWSVAECLDHLAATNRAYLDALTRAATAARAAGRMRRGPMKPGWLGRRFAALAEPPVKTGRKIPAPQSIRPRPNVGLTGSLALFIESQDAVRAYVRDFADIDLTGVRFVNPFIPGLRFSLGSGLLIILAHDRRHLWQAWNARRAAEASAAQDSA